ncbi:MAG: hypothetical protein V4510_10990 [bacterium]
MRWAALGVVLVFMAVAQGSDATFTMTLEPLAQPLQPDGAPGNLTAHFTLDCQTAMQMGAGGLAPSLTIHPRIESAPGIIIVLAPRSLAFDASKCQTPTMELTLAAVFNVQATVDAAGEAPLALRLDALVDSNAPPSPAAPPPQTANATAVVHVAYRGLVGFNAPVTIGEAKPGGEIRYALVLQNLGNAPSDVVFTLPSADAHWAVDPLPIVRLGARGEANATRALDIVVHMPEQPFWNNREASQAIQLQPQSTLDPGQTGNRMTVNLLSRVRGFSWSGWAPLVPLGIILLIAVAVVVVRRRLRKSKSNGPKGKS